MAEHIIELKHVKITKAKNIVLKIKSSIVKQKN